MKSAPLAKNASASGSYATFTTQPKVPVRRATLIAKYGLAEGITRFAQGESA